MVYILFCRLGLETVASQEAGPVGRSGRFRLLLDGNRSIDVLMDRLIERDENRISLGKQGGRRRRHSFNSFAGLDFNFSELVDVEVENVRAQKFNFTALIPAPNATLNVMVFRFLEPGNVTIGNETREVMNGTFAFTIEVSNKDFTPNRYIMRNYDDSHVIWRS